MEETVRFPVGTISLEGRLSLPTDGRDIGVVVCHPHPLRGGDLHNNVVAGLTEGLGHARIATLRFNFRGVGNSTGVHDDGRGEEDDVKAAVTYLLSRKAFSTVVVAGYSFGSVVGLKAGSDDPRVHKLIGVALPIRTRDLSFLHAVTKPKLLISGERDNFAPTAELKALIDKTPEPKSVVMIPHADHFFGGLEGPIGEAAADFLCR